MFTHLKRLTWKASLLTTAISLFAFTIALAASGDLDWTFGHVGLVSTNVSAPMRFEIVDDIAIQANGKIIAAGKLHDDDVPDKIALARYNADGSLDTTFSGDGKLITILQEDYVETAGVAVQLNGKIVLSGRVCKRDAFRALSCDLMLARYMPNGTLDTTFRGNGWLRLDDGGDNGSKGGLAVLGNGKILVAGYDSSNGIQMVIYRFLANGNLDTTFDGDGKVTLNFPMAVPTDLEILNNGKIMILGSTNTGTFTNNFDFALARLNANGSLDSTFSGDGMQITNFGDQESPSGMAIQADGRIVVAGRRADESGNELIIVARYNTSGNLDSTFNGTGKMTFKILPPFDPNFLANDVIIQPDGRIIIAGNSFNGATWVEVLMRILPSGGFDTTFSGDGKVIVVGINIYALALDADGKYMLGGVMSKSTISGFRNDFALARILP
jgi:uncharacterized delta-60 repeat protein